MGRHTFFIVAAYAFTFVVLAGVIAQALLEYRALRRALARYPERAGRDEGASP